ncbi:MAG: hypothetical protein K8R23_06895 [Chthoniobacter sp.]|nr:hypothetical protein [Chthoniobacter sp.]
MMRPGWRGVFALLLLTQLAGCGLLPRKKATKPAAPPAPVLVGTITLVNTEQHFVLIDSTSSSGPPPDVMLQSHAPDGPVAELKSSAIRRRPFTIADIVKGTPQVGDQVFQTPR